MSVEYKVIQGRYMDSVLLMQITRDLEKEEGVEKAGVMAGTEENLAVLQNLGFEIPKGVSPDSIVIAVEAKDEETAKKMVKEAEGMMDKKASQAVRETYRMDEVKDEIKKGDFPLVFISTPGEYVDAIASKALENGANLHIFSSNVPVEVEKKLKEKGHDEGLLVMGPDSGTTIIRGKGIGFANAVKEGDIGVIASSGTGLQEFTVLLDEADLGVSSALGVGSKDLSKYIGGIMTIDGIRALEDSKMMVIISKHPDKGVMDEVIDMIKDKPSVFIPLGDEINEKRGRTLITGEIEIGVNYILKAAGKKERSIETPNPNKDLGERRLLRGWFAGGSLCYQAQAILASKEIHVYSNSPSDEQNPLPEKWDDVNICIDTGAEEYVKGRPHPMIDPQLRNSYVVKDSERDDVRVILVDIILGYGSSMDPLAGLDKMKKGPLVVASVTGTKTDPQGLDQIKKGLDELGIIHFTAGGQAARYAAKAMEGAK